MEVYKSLYFEKWCEQASIKFCEMHMIHVVTPEIILFLIIRDVVVSPEDEHSMPIDIPFIKNELMEEINHQIKEMNPSLTPLRYPGCFSYLCDKARKLAAEQDLDGQTGTVNSVTFIKALASLKENILAKVVSEILLEDPKILASLNEREKVTEKRNEYEREKQLLNKIMGASERAPTAAAKFQNNSDFIFDAEDLIDDKVPYIGRKEEIARTLEIMAKRDKPNVLHIGEPGVGKTSLVIELARMIRDEDPRIPEEIKESNIYIMNIGDLIKGTGVYGTLESKLSDALNNIAEEANPIVYIDELQMAVSEHTTVDIAALLGPYLTTSNIRFIGSTTPQGLKKLESKPAFLRRFHKLSINEPSLSETKKIIEGIIGAYSEHHNVSYDKDAIDAAINLTNFHLHNRFLPDKAIDLLDETGAHIKLKGKKQVTKKDIEHVLCKTCNIPEKTVGMSEKETYKNLPSILESHIYGQSDAIQAVSSKILMYKAGLLDNNKPIGSFLFVGPTGTGKTELTYELSKALQKKVLRYDMSEYSEAFTVSNLIGSPAGYVGYDQGGLLTNDVLNDPSSIILFDEIEKAHPKIFNTLLQVLDYGMLTDNHGNKVDFRNTIIIMTSNCGASNMAKKGLGFGKSSEYTDMSVIPEAVKKTFSPEFIARLSSVVTFNPLNEDMIKKIVIKEIEILQERMKEKRVKLSVDDTAVKHIMDCGYTPEKGARNIKAVVEKEISELLIAPVLYGKLSENGGTAKISFDSEGYTVQTRANPKRQATRKPVN